MKKILTLLAILLSTLSAQAESVAPYKGSRIFWDTTTRKTVFSPGWYARIIQLQDGRLMAACEHSGIDIAYSTNLGNTWSAPQKLVTNPSGISECVPDLIQLSDGTIIVAYNPRPNAPYSQERRFGIRCKYSTDNGATWSDEVFVNDASHTFEDGCWEPSMLQLPSGEVQLYFADEGPYTHSGEQQISMCRSFDQGKTWTAAQKVSFRAGFRDGMPVPILLKDESEIVFVFEDNGWYPPEFFPTTARCSLQTNWHNYWVDSTSPNRERTLDPVSAPLAKGGAPYLRQLPNGETVISWQSSWNSSTGQLTMLTAVGDDHARNFKSVSHPFIISGSTSVMWNSVAVIDTGIVVAVGGVDSQVEMIKGYPKTQFECAYGTPDVDGRVTKGEGYFHSNAAQIRMGCETGTISLCDMAYDLDSLYFIARISDRTQVESGAYADGVRFFVEAAGASDTRPQTTTFQYYVKLSGALSRYVGTGAAFRNNKSGLPHVEVRASSSYYVVELAIPWEDMGLAGPPAHDLRVNIEIRNGNTSGLVSESIPDADANAPWTWMPLHLAEMPADAAVAVATAHSLTIAMQGKQLSVSAPQPVRHAALYTADGRLVATCQPHSTGFALPLASHGVGALRIEFENGKTESRKVMW